MIDRVATAMYGAGATDAWGCTDYEMLARAAIEAMREPTNEMMDAHGKRYYSSGNRTHLHDRAYADWTRMIDAALAANGQCPQD